MFKETSLRSAVKAMSWRITGTFFTAISVYVLTDNSGLALTVGAVEFVSKFALFFIHERLWDKIKFGRQQKKPAVLWLTGLPGAGKSSIAEALVRRLQKTGLKVEHLDGDSIRRLFPNTGYSKEERDLHIQRVGFLASRLEQNGIMVVASLVSPYRHSRQFVRSICANFIEIHVSTSLAECERRDPKGLYAKARRGEILDFTGVTAPYEKPESPEITLDTENISVNEAVSKIIKKLEKLQKTGP